MDRKQIVACLIALLCAGCSRAPRIVVGSKNFTEQLVLGEIVAQQIERSLGVRVERKLNLGGTLLAHEALASGAIDLYPEYTGTALTAVLKQPPAGDPADVFQRVAAEYHLRWRLAWLAPLGFNNTFAMVVRGETARNERLATISDAAKAQRLWRLGAGYEFTRRPDGLDGLLAAYGLHVEGSPLAMDLGLLYQALEKGKVDMVAANSTDGLLLVKDFTMLADDRRYFPPYECAIVVREAALARIPGLRAALEGLSGRIGEAAIRSLNQSVDGDHRALREVAGQFLKASSPQDMRPRAYLPPLCFESPAKRPVRTPGTRGASS